MKHNNISNNVYLKSTWDAPMKIGVNSNFHTTRKHEHDKLIDFISAHYEGSLLVCGNRGVGKSSVVFRAINEIQDQNKNLLVPKIDATSDAFSFDQNNSDSLIRQLVRSLYKEIKIAKDIPKKTQNKTAELYIRSKASSISEDQSTTHKIVFEKIFTIKGNIISSLPVFVLSILHLTIPSSLYPLWLLPILALASSSIFFLSFVYMKKTKHIQNIASYHYRSEDNHIRLQQDLGDLLFQIKKHYKILFVIDELDKIKDAHSLIKQSKTLINQGNALFIFISDPSILESLKEKNAKEYTLFSQKLFIKRPLFQEMDQFLDGIIDWDKSQDAKSRYKNFKNYIEYISHTDFFELYHAIRDHTTYENIQMINMSLDAMQRKKSILQNALRWVYEKRHSKKQLQWQNNENIQMINISLDAMQRKKSILQNAVRWVYEKRYSKKESQWQNNDKMLDALYQMTELLEKTPINSMVVINGDDFTIGGNKPLHMDWSDKLAINDLFYYFKKCGYLKQQNENNFIFTGELNKIDPDTQGIYVAEQRLFIEEFKKFMELSIKYGNIHNKWINDKGFIFDLDTFNTKWNELVNAIPNVSLSGLEDHKNTFYDMERPNSPVFTTQKFEQMTADLQATNQLLLDYYSNIEFLVLLLCKNPSIVHTGTFETLEGSDKFNKLGVDCTKPFKNIILEIQYFDTKIVLMLAHQPDPKIVRRLLNKKFSWIMFIICVEANNQNESNSNEWKLLKHMRDDIKGIISDYKKGRPFKTNIPYVMNLPFDNNQLRNLISALKLLHN